MADRRYHRLMVALPSFVVRYVMGSEAFKRILLPLPHDKKGFTAYTYTGIPVFESKYLAPRWIIGFDSQDRIVEQYELEDIE